MAPRPCRQTAAEATAAGVRNIRAETRAADDWDIAISSFERPISDQGGGWAERGRLSALHLEEGSKTLVTDSLDKAVNHAIVHHGPLAVRVLDLSRSRSGHADHLSGEEGGEGRGFSMVKQAQHRAEWDAGKGLGWGGCIGEPQDRNLFPDDADAVTRVAVSVVVVLCWVGVGGGGMRGR